MTSSTSQDPRFVLLSPHPEEARSAVSIEISVYSGSSFETQTASAPRDEVRATRKSIGRAR